MTIVEPITPAAPVIQVILRTRYGGSDSLSAFLDSGADGTIVPLAILRQIRARYNEVIIGCDVLNQITVILDGPIGICEIRI